MMKFDVNKFNYRNDFNIWHINMRTLVVQKGLFKALKSVDNFSKEMDDEEKEISRDE
jgi:hypothetical protein